MILLARTMHVRSAVNRRRVVRLIIWVTLVEAAVLSLGLLLLFGLKAWNEQRNEAIGIVQGGGAFDAALAVALPVTIALLLLAPLGIVLATRERRERRPGSGQSV